MSHCLIYKKGSSAVIRGVECDFMRVKYSEAEAYKKQGWVGTLSELSDEDEFLKVFNSNPTALTKDEMVEYAKEKLNMKLSKRMLEENMIAKIAEALND